VKLEPGECGGALIRVDVSPRRWDISSSKGTLQMADDSTSPYLRLPLRTMEVARRDCGRKRHPQLAPTPSGRAATPGHLRLIREPPQQSAIPAASSETRRSEGDELRPPQA
jgi:hypothetical protein